MTFIRLTSDCQFFTVSLHATDLILNWNMSMDLSRYDNISLREIQIGPLTISKHDYLLKIYSNIIARTLYNPLRELACIRVSRNSSFIDSVITPGLFHITEIFKIILESHMTHLSNIYLRNNKKLILKLSLRTPIVFNSS